MWDVLGEGMLGYVLLIESSQAEAIADAQKILAAFRRMASVPFVVAVNRTDGLGPEDETRLRTELDLEPNVPIVPCDATEKASVKTVLLALLHAVLESIEREPAVQA
jgi:hypothetical protein